MEKQIKDLLDLSQAKLEGLVQGGEGNAYYNEFDVLFNNGYSQAIKDIASFAGLDENDYGIVSED